jgi:hypothetical protein
MKTFYQNAIVGQVILLICFGTIGLHFNPNSQPLIPLFTGWWGHQPVKKICFIGWCPHQPIKKLLNSPSPPHSPPSPAS